MAEVWEALDRRLERPVAVKLFAGDAVGGDLRARFLREAKVAVQFAHPSAVTVYDAGEDDGSLYLVMELVDGPTLAQVLAERGRLDPSEAVDVADQILAAVAAGHRAGLAHRDIKPSNILFTNDSLLAGDAGQQHHGAAGGLTAGRAGAKLADFGIAKGTDELAAQLTATGQMVGTPRYLSPEQATGHEATPASDLYAMGVVLFEMLAGTPPFVRDTPLATAAAHRHVPVPSLLERRPDLDPSLAAAVERAMAKEPTARYPDAAAMRRALAASSRRVRPRGVQPNPTAGASPPGSAAAPTLTETGALPAVPPSAAAPGRPSTVHPARSRRSGAAVLATLVLLAAAAVGGGGLWLSDAGGGGDDPASDQASDQAAPNATGAGTTTVPPETTTTEPDTTTTQPETTTTTAPDTTTTQPETTTTTAPDTTTTQPDTTTTTAPDATTTAPADTAPPTVARLTALLAENPDAHGKKGSNLLDKVVKLQEKPGEKRAEEARKRLDDVSKWAEKGELDPATAGLATRALELVAASSPDDD